MTTKTQNTAEWKQRQRNILPKIEAKSYSQLKANNEALLEACRSGESYVASFVEDNIGNETALKSLNQLREAIKQSTK